MNEERELTAQVEAWRAAGVWRDEGRWVRERWSAEDAYWPTTEEIRTKCELFRSIRGWRGASKRSPRGGKHAVATTAGI